MSQNSIEEILDAAIAREQDACDLYNRLADEVARPALKEELREMAAQELEHKRRLETVRESDINEGFSAERLETLKLAEYVQPITPHADMNYRDLLAFAMKAEERAQKLYHGLAEATSSPELKALFAKLAREEAIHKQEFEKEYDDLVYGDA